MVQSFYDTAYPQLGVHPRKTKTYVHTKTYSPVFVAAVFRIAKKRKKNKNLSGWIHK